MSPKPQWATKLLHDLEPLIGSKLYTPVIPNGLKRALKSTIWVALSFWDILSLMSLFMQQSFFWTQNPSKQFATRTLKRQRASSCTQFLVLVGSGELFEVTNALFTPVSSKSSTWLWFLKQLSVQHSGRFNLQSTVIPFVSRSPVSPSEPFRALLHQSEHLKATIWAPFRPFWD